MEIIRRELRDWKPREADKKDLGKYQYLYRASGYRISLVYLECRGGEFMWETLASLTWGWRLGGKEEIKRFAYKEDAEEYIIKRLLNDDLGGLVEWKIAKSNMIIEE